MAVSNDDILKVVMEVLLEDGTIAQNVFWFVAELAAQQSDASVLTAVETWIEALYSDGSSYLPSSMTQRVCWIDRMAWDPGESKWVKEYFVGYFTPTIGFNDINEPLPNMSAPLITFPTSRPKSRGRKFIFPFAEDAQDATFLIAAALTALTNMADEALDDIVLGPLNELIPCIVRVAADTVLKFDTAIVTNVLATQRRRRPGVGI